MKQSLLTELVEAAKSRLVSNEKFWILAEAYLKVQKASADPPKRSRKAKK